VAASAWARTGEEHGIGIEERTGAFLPLQTRFTAEDGREITLGEAVHGPTILSLVYYRCPNACDLLLIGVADAVRPLSGVPGKDYSLLTITIDERETPADALAAKRIALASIQKPFPPEAWRFLTGTAENIQLVADAVGFRFHRDGEEFDHPMGLVVLSPAGKVTRYLIGSEFLPVDLQISILEASTGTVGPTIARVLRFCLHYDAQNRRFTFNTLKVSAVVILTMAGILVAYLVFGGKRRRLRRGASR
jgi:protein SCO1/2